MKRPERWQPAPRFVVAELTNRCNLRCAHCASASGKARPHELDGDQWCQVIDQLADAGCLSMTLIGGEAFMHPDWLSIARHVNRRGIELAIITNGLLQCDAIVEGLCSLELANLGVSLDAATPATYQAVRGVDGFNKTWAFIQKMAAFKRFPIVAITSFSKINIHEFEALAQLIKPGPATWQVQFVHSIGSRFDKSNALSPRPTARRCDASASSSSNPAISPWLAAMDDFGYFPRDPLHALLHQRWKGCPAGRHVLGIRSDGALLPCLSLGDPYIEGSLRHDSLLSIWQNPNTFAPFRYKAESLSGPCAQCPKAARCLAGCPAMAVTGSGTLGDNPYCLRRHEENEVLNAIKGLCSNSLGSARK